MLTELTKDIQSNLYIIQDIKQTVTHLTPDAESQVTYTMHWESEWPTNSGKFRLKGHHVSQDLSFVLYKIFPVKAFIKLGVPHGLWFILPHKQYGCRFDWLMVSITFHHSAFKLIGYSDKHLVLIILHTLMLNHIRVPRSSSNDEDIQFCAMI